MAENCKHGMSPAWCTYCNPRVEPKKVKHTPRVYIESTAHGSAVLDVLDPECVGYALVKTSRQKDATRETFAGLNGHTKFVHIDGFPYFWAIQLILERAPNLQIIQLIPSMYQKLGENHRDLCGERNVRIVQGHHKPEMAWSEGENRSPFYHSQRKFFQELSGEQKKLFEELLVIGFEWAQVTARYFCLKDEPFLTQTAISAEFGFSPINLGGVSGAINGVIRYLDPTFETGANSIRIAEELRKKVARLRNQHGSLLQVGSIIIRMNGVLAEITGNPSSRVPADMSLSRFEDYKELIKAKMDGRLEKLKDAHPKQYEAVTLRFGLLDGTHRTLEAVGVLMSITGERVRQLIEDVLESFQVP